MDMSEIRSTDDLRRGSPLEVHPGDAEKSLAQFLYGLKPQFIEGAEIDEDTAPRGTTFLGVPEGLAKKDRGVSLAGLLLLMESDIHRLRYSTQNTIYQDNNTFIYTLQKGCGKKNSASDFGRLAEFRCRSWAVPP